MNESPLFDAFADTYDADLNQALALTGEDKCFYANGRVKWLARGLERLNLKPKVILDFGCGIGDTTVLLRDQFDAHSALGLDVSERSIELAKARNACKGCEFKSFSEYVPDESVDLAYCNGVFHHIELPMRGAAVQYLYRCLRPGGIFALWENNPFNPGTRYVMSRIPFDRDAATLTPWEAKSMLGRHGFAQIDTEYCFFFPRFLKFLRAVEPWLASLPLGAQYQVLCRKSQAGEL